MVERSKKLFPPLKEGNNVSVGVSKCDKDIADPSNLIWVVMNMEDDRYKVETKYSVIENALEKNSLNKTKYNALKIIYVPQTETWIRTLVLNLLVLLKDRNDVIVPRVPDCKICMAVVANL